MDRYDEIAHHVARLDFWVDPGVRRARDFQTSLRAALASNPDRPREIGANREADVAAVEPLIAVTLIRDAVTAAPYVILVADAEMQYLTASDAACALLGYSRDELRGMKVPQVCEPDEVAEVLYQDMVRSDRQRGRIVLVRKDGRRIPAHYEAHATRVSGLQYYVSILFPLDD